MILIVSLCLVILNVDVKKERKFNLIPVKIGFYITILCIVTATIDGIAYSITEFNIENRVLMIANVNDVNLAILGPALALYGMPNIFLRRVKSLLHL